MTERNELKEIDVLISFYKERNTSSRNSEAQRTNITHFVITISGALLALIGYIGFLIYTLPIAIIIVMLGIYGAIMSAKLYERFQYHNSVAKSYERRINELCPRVDTKLLIRSVRKEHKKRFPRLYNMRLNKLWLLLHISIISLGIICIFIIVFNFFYLMG